MPPCFPRTSLSAAEAFSPKENIIESLYCARTRCGWSSVDQLGCPDARRYCRRIERGEQEDRTDPQTGTVYPDVVYNFKRVPVGASCIPVYSV
ncbi:MAG: hypothetical protein GY820_02020 [Gammaproteobacteria bacterium]|nr:hypothetical protein [Gammaproteobacteria bacterium]